MKAGLSLVLGLMMISLTGCATVMRGKTQGMQFNTEPPGATVVISDGANSQAFTSPKKVELKRKERYAVEVSKEGYRTVKFELKPQWDGASIGSVVLPGGTLLAATDTASGADRAFYTLETVKLPRASAPNEPPLQLVQHRGRLYTREEYQQVLEEEDEHRRAMSGT